MYSTALRIVANNFNHTMELAVALNETVPILGLGGGGLLASSQTLLMLRRWLSFVPG